MVVPGRVGLQDHKKEASNIFRKLLYKFL